MLNQIKENLPINAELISNPVNWIIIFLMIAIAGLSVSLIFHKPNS